MNKFKNATKRIVAIATSAALISSGAFATSLGDYPTNFVKSGAFNGQVVIGSGVGAADSAAAVSIISDLQAQFSGSTPQTVISYKAASATSSSNSVDLVSGSSELNYGENVGSVVKSSSTLKNSDNLAILQDETFRNTVGDQNFKQKLDFTNGVFNRQVHSTATRPGDTTRQSVISDNIYYPAQTAFATYELKLDSPVVFSTGPVVKSEFVGKTLRVMNNDYTIISGTVNTGTNVGGFSKMTLLGGANTISLEGGKTVTVDGKRISLGAVDSNQAQVIVDGQAMTIDKYSTDVVGGLNIGVLSVFPIVSGYPGSANLVIGGQKIEINGGTIKLNGQNLNTVNKDYTATASFLGTTASGFKGFKIDYKANHDMYLATGDSLVDPIFGGFSLVMDGTNTPNYSDLTVSSNGNSVHVAGTTASGNPFNQDLLTSTGLTATGSQVYVQGTSVGDRVFTSNSHTGVIVGSTNNGGTTTYTIAGTAIGDIYTATINGDTTPSSFTTTTTSVTDAATGLAAAINTDSDVNSLVTATSSLGVVTVTNKQGLGATTYTTTGTKIGTGTNTVSAGSLSTGTAPTAGEFDLTSTNVLGDGFLLQKDANEQYLYTINNVDTSTSAPADHKVSFEDTVYNSPLTDIVGSGWGTDLGMLLTESYINPIETVPFTSLGSQIGFDNNLLLNFMNNATGNSETPSLSAPGTKVALPNVGSITAVSVNFNLDQNDINGDQQVDEQGNVVLDFSRDTVNNEFDINVDSTNSAFENTGGTIADTNANDYKIKEFVTRYGVKVTVENKDKTNVVISTPDVQLKANVRLVSGVASTLNTQTMTVDKVNVDTEKAKLIAAGNTIISANDLAATTTTFDVTAPVLDTAVTGTNDLIVVGGPAVNSVARSLLGITTYDISQAGVNAGEGLIKYFPVVNSVLVYGYSAADTVAATNSLNKGGLSGNSVNTQ